MDAALPVKPLRCGPARIDGRGGRRLAHRRSSWRAGGAGVGADRACRRGLHGRRADAVCRTAKPHQGTAPRCPDRDCRGGRGARPLARGGRGGKSLFSAVVRRAWLGDDWRCSFDQCGRLERVALWLHPVFVSGVGGGSGGWPGAEPDVGTPQGQFGL